MRLVGALSSYIMLYQGGSTQHVGALTSYIMLYQGSSIRHVGALSCHIRVTVYGMLELYHVISG